MYKMIDLTLTEMTDIDGENLKIPEFLPEEITVNLW